jgi:hypothetical protein
LHRCALIRPASSRVSRLLEISAGDATAIEETLMRTRAPA